MANLGRNACFWLCAFILAYPVTVHSQRIQPEGHSNDRGGGVELLNETNSEARMTRTAAVVREALRSPGPRGIVILVADRSMARQYEDYFRRAYRTLVVGRSLESLNRGSMAGKSVTLTTTAALARALQSQALAISDLGLIVADDAADLFSASAVDTDVAGSPTWSSSTSLKVVGFTRPGWTMPQFKQKKEIPALQEPLGLDAPARQSLRFPQRLVSEKLSAYSFRQPDLLTRALLHPSKARRLNSTVSYRPLDYVGQCALEFVVSRYILKNGTAKSSEEMHLAKTRLLRQDTLARVAALNNLDQYVFVDEGPEKTSMTAFANEARSQSSPHRPLPSNRSSFLHNFVQSVAGAVYVDSGYDADTLERVLLKFFTPYL